jgi:hypothetical protein
MASVAWRLTAWLLLPPTNKVGNFGGRELNMPGTSNIILKQMLCKKRNKRC